MLEYHLVFPTSEVMSCLIIVLGKEQERDSAVLDHYRVLVLVLAVDPLASMSLLPPDWNLCTIDT